MRTRSRLRRGAFAAMVAGALGFGTAQAVAAPAARPDTGFRGCTQASCDQKCQTQYGVPGFCDGRGCRCLF